MKLKIGSTIFDTKFQLCYYKVHVLNGNGIKTASLYYVNYTVVMVKLEMY